MEKNIDSYQYKIRREARCKAHGHNSILIFFTGLSGSGKSTLANTLEKKLYKNGISTYVLDGDNIRQGINNDLNFSPEDRSENIRRIAEISKLFVDAGIVVLAAFINPYQVDREYIKSTVGAENYLEIYMNTGLEVCEERDVKGLYKKARKGDITDMTGISAPYEIPVNPSMVITNENSLEESVNLIFTNVKEKLRLN